MSYDIINYLRKVNAEQALIDKLITNLQQQNPEIKGDPKKVKKIIAGNVRRKTLTVVIGAYNLNPTYVRGLEQDRYFKQLPTPCLSYPLLHTITGTPVMESIANAKFGCGGINDATKHITTTNDTLLDMGSASFGIACWYKSTSTAANHGIVCKRNIAASTNAGFDVYVATGNTIELRISDGANTTLSSKSSATIHNGSWHSIICNIPSAGNLEIFVDGSSIGTTARGSVGSVNVARDMYEMARDNAGTIQEKLNGSIALFTIVKNIFSAQQITDFTNAIIDTRNECVFRPYNADWTAEPNAVSGLCQSS